ncbi:3-dehydroquinate dehydratase (3-dehydroquinase), partial [Coemansia sp. RSA 2598]
IRERRCVGKTWPQWWDVLGRDLGAPIAGADPEAASEPETKGKAADQPGTQCNKSVVVIGMRGVGKTSLGRFAARELGLEFVDLDEHLEKDVGKTIPEIVNGSGWATFRQHESRLLAQVLNETHPTGALVVCGGGVVEEEVNRKVLQQYMASGASVVCLKPNMQHVAAYLNRDKTRPAYAITSDINDVYARRLPLYAECCNYEYLVDKALLSMTDEDDHPGAWAVIERDFARLLRFATGRDLNRVDIEHPSFFVSLTTPDVREYLPSKLDCVTAGAHAIELRVDLLLRAADFIDADFGDQGVEDAFVHYVHRQFTMLRHFSRLPVVFTVRTAPQGGAFPADADSLRLRLLHSAVQWSAEYVDVEVDNAAPALFAARRNSLVIASYHDTTGTKLRWGAAECEFANEILARARSCGDIAKLISVANSWEDNLDCMRFIQRNHSVAAPLIALNMGYVGQLSRVLCPCLTPVTHPLLTTAAAPGQISVAQINQARALAGLMPSKRFFLFGTPVQQSPSPAMHNAGFAAVGLPHSYGLKETAAVDDQIAATIQAVDFGGASVTIPHKQAIIPLLDSLTPAAQRIGAVNTVIPVESATGGQRSLLGDNTDYLGIVDSLRQKRVDFDQEAALPDFASSSALVIGAGGTSRAALYALHTLGVRSVVIFNRTLARAEELVEEFAELFDSLAAVPQLEDAAK